MHVNPADRLHHLRYAARERWRDEQVHVIGDEDIDVDRDAAIARGACEAITEEHYIITSAEIRLAIVTALDDMQRQVGDKKAR